MFIDFYIFFYFDGFLVIRQDQIDAYTLMLMICYYLVDSNNKYNSRFSLRIKFKTFYRFIFVLKASMELIKTFLLTFDNKL